VNTIRVVIVDDEPLTRERVSNLVRDTPDLELVGEARNGLEALDMITKLEPDLIFIDVEMPELDGFGVVASLEVNRVPAVVFVTAYERYALKAFDVGAVDYLHKPVTASRFAASVARARDRLDRPSPRDWSSVVQTAAAAARVRGARRSFVERRGNTHHFVPVGTVDWIDVADNYLQLHVGSRAHLCRGTMKQAEEELDPQQFVRIHRSTIVAVDRIKTIRSGLSGAYVIELEGGVRLRCSRQYADKVRALVR
jgi:two-component system LytT family response regulator